jgi:hypothetical protein
MEISTKSVNAMKKAKTPEDAYKIFAGAVSEGLNQLMADALAKALSKASVTVSSPSIDGWEKLVRGIGFQTNWGTPGLIAPPSSMTLFSSSLLTSAAPSIMGGTITVGGSWSF